MSYVIINNRDSTDLPGLIISELPPITKPRQRVQEEEIDGRDGDQIRELGYESYDKELKIGLSYHYDIDDIISFFSQSGWITFSNEPDKEYRFTQLDQIDFEAMLKFKTAKIKLHVQPFKYLLAESPVASSAGTAVVYNRGNIFSRPVIVLTGTGNISLSVNADQVLTISLGSDPETVTIDCIKMDAYDGQRLRNRDIIGNYDDIRLDPGRNTITADGAVTKIVIKNQSRWI